MEPRTDCRHFTGQKPCPPGKASGASCGDGCPDFGPRGRRALIIKLGSLGDVLRTTFLPAALRRAEPDLTVDWLTQEEHFPVLQGLEAPGEPLPFDAGTLARLQVERYHRLINLELTRPACAAATLARADEKFGFGLTEDGAIRPFNGECAEFFDLCLSDAAKRANRRSYQSHVLTLCRLPGAPTPPLYCPVPEELRRGAERLRAAGIDPTKPCVGLNLGSGRRWVSKRWPLQRFLELAGLLAGRGIPAALLCGPDEPELAAHARAEAAFPVVGPALPLREFAGVVANLSLVVSADTFALHLALALGRKVVGLFGPTSADEVELFGAGVKLVPDRPCRCYYRAACDDADPCVATIPAERVAAETLELLGAR